MKKVFFAALFLGAFTTANAVELDVRKDCHAYACEMVGQVEELIGDEELSLEDADAIYDMAYESC